MVREFFVAGSNTAVTFDPGEKVLDGVALPVTAVAEAARQRRPDRGGMQIQTP